MYPFLGLPASLRPWGLLWGLSINLGMARVALSAKSVPHGWGLAEKLREQPFFLIVPELALQSFAHSSRSGVNLGVTTTY